MLLLPLRRFFLTKRFLPQGTVPRFLACGLILSASLLTLTALPTVAHAQQNGMSAYITGVLRLSDEQLKTAANNPSAVFPSMDFSGEREKAAKAVAGAVLYYRQNVEAMLQLVNGVDNVRINAPIPLPFDGPLEGYRSQVLAKMTSLGNSLSISYYIYAGIGRTAYFAEASNLLKAEGQSSYPAARQYAETALRYCDQIGTGITQSDATAVQYRTAAENSRAAVGKVIRQQIAALNGVAPATGAIGGDPSAAESAGGAGQPAAPVLEAPEAGVYRADPAAAARAEERRTALEKARLQEQLENEANAVKLEPYTYSVLDFKGEGVVTEEFVTVDPRVPVIDFSKSPAPEPPPAAAPTTPPADAPPVTPPLAELPPNLIPPPPVALPAPNYGGVQPDQPISANNLPADPLLRDAYTESKSIVPKIITDTLRKGFEKAWELLHDEDRKRIFKLQERVPSQAIGENRYTIGTLISAFIPAPEGEAIVSTQNAGDLFVRTGLLNAGGIYDWMNNNVQGFVKYFGDSFGILSSSPTKP